MSEDWWPTNINVDFTVTQNAVNPLEFTFTDATTWTCAYTGGIVHWRWDFGDGSPVVEEEYSVDHQVSTPQTHVYASPGSYPVSLEIVLNVGQNYVCRHGPRTKVIHPTTDRFLFAGNVLQNKMLVNPV